MNPPILQPAEKYVKAGKNTPNLAPMPTSSNKARYGDRPQGVWETWWGLPKEPLLVTVNVSGPGTGEALQLDAVLSMAVLRWAQAPWHFGEDEARVIPLPLDLLGIVPLPLTGRSQPPRLPVWASTPLVMEQPGRLEALCIGHADVLRELLGFVHEVGGRPCRGWQVRAVPLSAAEALEVIQEQRPLPGREDLFTPPYWFDWLALQKGPAGPAR